MCERLCICVEQVKVCQVADVQGRGYRAIIISTVRTSAIESQYDEINDFLMDPKVRRVESLGLCRLVHNMAQCLP